MNFLTDFADQAVVLPLAVTVAILLALSGWPRGAVAWIGAVLGTLAAMLALKLLFAACGPVFPSLGIRSPSGHTAAATVTYGGLAALLGLAPWLAFGAAAVAALVFGASRLALGVHTVPEVVLGAAVGLAGAAILIRLAGPAPRMRRTLLLAAPVVVLVLLHGAHLHAESTIGRLAFLLDVWPLSACRSASG